MRNTSRYNNTQIHARNASNGLIDTSRPGSRDKIWNRSKWHKTSGGSHLIGWAPAPITNNQMWMWSESNFLSVSNFYTARGLELLAELAQAGGRASDAKLCANEAADLRKSIQAHMWDAKDARFCDGICRDVDGNHSIYSDM